MFNKKLKKENAILKARIAELESQLQRRDEKGRYAKKEKRKREPCIKYPELG